MCLRENKMPAPFALTPQLTDFCDLKVWGVCSTSRQAIGPAAVDICWVFSYGSEAVYPGDNATEQIRTSVLKILHLQSDTSLQPQAAYLCGFV